jgi:hypothetical protein
VGQSRQVEAVLGPPLREFGIEGGIVWRYSESGSFRSRLVSFGADGGVASTTAEFDVD